ncbi:hypothetical protein [Phenylobacterium sp.]|nr:hypothetical protein [Phenylobacterium sp.]
MTRKTAKAAPGARPSPWAVALLVVSTGFAAVAVMLLTTGFGLL